MIARRQGVLIAGGLMAAFAVGLLLGRTIAPDSGSRGDPNSQQVIAGDTRGNASRRPFQERRPDGAERPEVVEDKNFAYRRLRLDMGGDAPKACLQFNRDLNADGDVNYGDFVRVTPAGEAAIEVDGTSLCLTGLAFDKDYRVRLRAGLPSAKDERLERAEEVVVAFGDKPSYAGFAGDGVINQALQAISLTDGPIPWLGDPFWAKAVVISAITWRWTGYNMIFYLAAMQNFDRSIFEAARIASPQIKTVVGEAHFPSIEDWVRTDVKGWTLADAIDDAQYAELQTAAREELKGFAAADGSVRCASPAHIATAGKRPHG